jgi:hypothetical protein
MDRSRACSWCNTMNAAGVERCRCCGHDAERPRLYCQCRQCERRLGLNVPTAEEQERIVAELEAEWKAAGMSGGPRL